MLVILILYWHASSYTESGVSFSSFFFSLKSLIGFNDANDCYIFVFKSLLKLDQFDLFVVHD